MWQWSWDGAQQEVVTVHKGGGRDKMAVGQLVVFTADQPNGQQEYGVLVITVRGRVWSSHGMGKYRQHGESCYVLPVYCASYFWPWKWLAREQ